MLRNLLVVAGAFGVVAATSSYAAALTLAPAAPVYGSQLNVGSPGFNIVLNYSSAPTAPQAAAFAAAEATWESLITGYKLSDIANNNVNITVNLQAIDGVGGVLGSAGPTNAKLNAAQTAVTPTYLYTQTGTMTFDTADVAGLLGDGSFDEVVLHEMGHVLGIGTLWDSSDVGFAGRQELYVNNSGQYTGAFGLAAYNAEFGQAGTFVPVELGGGAGTANGHWDEVNGGAGLTGRVSLLTGKDMRDEIMTGWLNTPAFISQLTIQGMQDLGYDVVPVPEPTSLAALGLAAVALRRRARR